MNYLKLSAPPTKDELRKAQDMISFAQLCADVSSVYNRNEMNAVFMDIAILKRGIAHASNEGKLTHFPHNKMPNG